MDYVNNPQEITDNGHTGADMLGSVQKKCLLLFLINCKYNYKALSRNTNKMQLCNRIYCSNVY